MGKTRWKNKEPTRCRNIEKRLLIAIAEEDEKKVRTFLDELCRAGGFQNLAACKAREFINKIEMKKRRKK